MNNININMSFYVSPAEEYNIRRINEWYINMNTNTIFGEIQKIGLNFYVGVSGYILSYIDNYVIARIECKTYALVLGNITQDKMDRKCEYMAYLKNIVQQPSIML